jgi:hypothetical protein
MHSCHCSKCRKAHGSAFRTGATVPVDQFRFVHGEDLIQTWRDRPGGYAAPFCRVCGSSAPLAWSDRGIVSIPAGLFDDDPGMQPKFHIFVGSKAPWWTITDGAPQFEEWLPGFGPNDRR